MSVFVELPVSKKSLAFRKPIYGVGINNAAYMVSQEVNGKTIRCPYYRAWKSMLERSFCPKSHERHPTYIGCSVAKEWLTFSNFRAWMKTQDWHGNQLDKDLLIPGNKVYGPETCIFISGAINSLLADHAARRGDCPQGVSFHKQRGKYRADCRESGKQKYLGYFATIKEAEITYLTFKGNLVKEMAKTQPAIIMDALLRHAALINNMVTMLIGDKS